MNADHYLRVKTAMNSVAGRLTAVVVVLSLSLLPWLLAAEAPIPPQRQANRERLSQMTAAERARLEENRQVYQEMTPAERDRLKTLQSEIDNSPELKLAFAEYQVWADQLSPVDRHELRQAQDPEARRQLIEKLRRRPSPGEMPETFASDRPGNGPPFVVGNNSRSRLLEKLFGGVTLPFGDRFGSCVPEMETIIRILEKELPSESREGLVDLDSFTRKVRVLKLTLERRPVGPLALRIFGPGSELVEKVLSQLPPDGPVRQLPGNRNFNPNQPDPRGTMLVMVLLRGLMMETQRTIENYRPRPDLLIAFQDKLSESERNRLNRMNREDRQQELGLLYVKKQVPGIGELQQLLGSLEIDRFLQELNNRLRPGAGPIDGDDRRDKKGRFPPVEGPRRPGDSLNRESPKD